MNELACFAGAGGGILGGKLLGWRTVCAVEIDPYCQAILMQRQNEGILAPFPIWDDIRSFDGRPWRGIVDVVSGGFPCQDISCAGRGEGLNGENSGLWTEMARVIGEVRPRYVFVENSPMLVVRGLGRVLGDLAELGYDARWGIISAADAGAPHLRKRIWIVADAECLRRRESAGHPDTLHPAQREESAPWIGSGSEAMENPNQSNWEQGAAAGNRKTGTGPLNEPSGSGGRSATVADPKGHGRQESARKDGQPLTGQCGKGGMDAIGSGSDLEDTKCIGPEEPGRCGLRGEAPEEREAIKPGDAGWWISEPRLGRVANGVAHRVDRLKALGNGQVPAVVRLAWNTLMNAQ